MDDDTAKKLTTTVHRWLSYQQNCGRDILFSESYIAHPVAEFLSHAYTYNLHAEYNHPAFEEARPGRPRQIDFVTFLSGSPQMSAAIEAKWIAEAPYDKQLIVNDLLRLECLRNPRPNNPKKFFLVSGRLEHFDKNFMRLQVNPGNGMTRQSFFRHYFSSKLENPHRDVIVRESTPRFRKFYCEYEYSYKAIVPNRFYTELVDRKRSDGICTYLWRVSSVGNRVPFSPNSAGWNEPEQ